MLYLGTIYIEEASLALATAICVDRNLRTASTFVLLSILVYWMQLFHIRKTNINKIGSITTNFLWSGVGVVGKFHLTEPKTISRSVQKGRWGVIETRSFNLALLVESILRLFFEKGLRKNIMFGKYIK